MQDFALADDDVVEESNLNGLAGAISADVGWAKVTVAAEQICHSSGSPLEHRPGGQTPAQPPATLQATRGRVEGALNQLDEREL